MWREWQAVGTICIAAALTASCSPSGAEVERGQRQLDGYAGLALGSSLDEALLVASPSQFNPYGLKECLDDMPLRGCFMSPENESTTFRRVDGIPYGLQLEFNRLGALTDITLKFVRRRTYDRELNPIPATIKKSECSDIVERTIDWVTAEYGSLAVTRPKDPKTQAATTPKGNAYWMQSSTDGSGFVATGEAPMKNGRSVGLFAHFLMLDGEPDCDLSVSFEDAETVERRVSESETQADLKQVVEKADKPQAEEKRRYPYVAPDGVDITSEADERNWKQYGTTQPDGGE